MTGRHRDEDAPTAAPRGPWHNRTSTVLGVSLAGLAALAILVISINHVTRQFTEPDRAPISYLEPTTSNSDTRSPTTDTTTRSRAPVTRDIDPGPTPSSTESTEANSESVGANNSESVRASTKSAEPSTRKSNSRLPRTRDPDSPPEEPALNEGTTEATATLDPAT